MAGEAPGSGYTEVVYFDSPRDLLDKCRYYLDHADERRAIAARMRDRARQELTVKTAAGRGNLKILIR